MENRDAIGSSKNKAVHAQQGKGGNRFSSDSEEEALRANQVVPPGGSLSGTSLPEEGGSEDREGRRGVRAGDGSGGGGNLAGATGGPHVAGRVRQPFTEMNQLESDMALARAIQEQFESDEAFARALQAAEDSATTARMMAPANEGHGMASDFGSGGKGSQDKWDGEHEHVAFEDLMLGGAGVDLDQMSYQERMALSKGGGRRGLNDANIAALPTSVFAAGNRCLSSSGAEQGGSEVLHNARSTGNVCIGIDEGWAPHQSNYGVECPLAEYEVSKYNDVSVSCSVSSGNQVERRRNRRKLEIMDGSRGQLVDNISHDKNQGKLLEQPSSGQSYHKTDSSNINDGALRNLMEAFLGPPITIEDIAQAFAACDGDVNAAAMQLAALSVKDNEIPLEIGSEGGFESGPLSNYQGKRTLEQALSSDAKGNEHAEWVRGQGSQSGTACGGLGGRLETTLGNNPHQSNASKLEGLSGQGPSWHMAESSTSLKGGEITGGEDNTREATADFIYSMFRGGDGGVEMSTIQEILGYFQGDTQKCLETVLNMTNDTSDLDFTAPGMQIGPPLSLSPSEDSPLMSLLECCPNVDPERAAFVLNEHKGDLEAAAIALLQEDDVPQGRYGMLIEYEMVAPTAPPMARSQVNDMANNPGTKALLQRLQAKYPTVEMEVLRDVLSATTSFSSASETLQAAGFTPGPHPRPSLHAIMAEQARASQPSRPPPLNPPPVGGAFGAGAAYWGSPSNSEDEQSPNNRFAVNDEQRSERGYNRKWERIGSSSASASRSFGRRNRERESNWGGASNWAERNIHNHGNLAPGQTNEFARQREVANQHYRLAKYYFHEANRARESGLKNYSMEMVAKGKEQNELAKEANRRASRRILTNQNMQHANQLRLDLHGQLVEEALEKLDAHLRMIASLGSVKTLVVITGHGRHSQGGVARVKPAVIDYLQSHGVLWTEVNPGCMVIDYQDIIASRIVA